MSAPRLLGAVLAGGESRRFGRDKATESLGGITLADRARSVLEAVSDEVVVVTSAVEHPSDWRVVRDLRTGCGPLAGIEAALAHAMVAGLDGAFILACDLPLVSMEVLSDVVAALGPFEAAAPERQGPPGLEPLCAVYRTTCLQDAGRLLDAGERAAHALFRAVGGVTVRVAEESFLNVNTPESFASAERSLGVRS